MTLKAGTKTKKGGRSGTILGGVGEKRQKKLLGNSKDWDTDGSVAGGGVKISQAAALGNGDQWSGEGAKLTSMRSLSPREFAVQSEVKNCSWDCRKTPNGVFQKDWRKKEGKEEQNFQKTSKWNVPTRQDPYQSTRPELR